MISLRQAKCLPLIFPTKTKVLVEAEALMLKKYLQNVLVFKQIFETAFDEKFLVPSGSKNENIILDGFDLNEAEHRKLNSLKKICNTFPSFVSPSLTKIGPNRSAKASKEGMVAKRIIICVCR